MNIISFSDKLSISASISYAIHGFLAQIYFHYLDLLLLMPIGI